MDHPYQTSMQLPAAYAVITEEEMTYLGGGSDIVLGQAFGYRLVLDTDQFLTFCANVVGNFGYYLLGASFSYVTNIFESGAKNGLSIAGSVAHAWNRLETPGSRIGAVGLTGLAGVYVGLQAVSIFRSLRNLYDAVFNPMPNFETAAAGADAA